MFKVFYYYYYLFYTHILPDPEPRAYVVFVLSFTQSLIITGLIGVIASKSNCYLVSKWLNLAILVLIIIINYLYYNRTNRATEIIKNKPKFFGSHKLSIALVLITSLIAVSWLFWGSFYIRNIILNCK